MVYCLLVMPYNTNIIWAGTESGIFESTDNGQSWHFADNGLPAVSIWQMFVQDNSIVVATHGRGIWSVDLMYVNNPEKEVVEPSNISCYPNPNRGIFNLSVENDYMGEVTVKVFNTSGKMVFEEILNKSDAVLNEKIEIKDTEPGIYLVSVHYKNSKTTARVIVQ
ncbi:MAG: T9SS type A sorting domain-containing protein [Bacteroidales bacterium]|nr:T9SS type A sorting domain-containing protein [Bacteroidales bacterium]